MVVIFLRTLIVYVTLITVIRLMGKRQIGEMQPFEFIVTLIIADLACIPMSDVNVPLIYGIVSILALFLLHQIVSLVEKSGNFAKKTLSGKPSIVITPYGVDLKELKKNNIGVDDLIESMRAQGYFYLDQLNYAIFEANGKLSAFEKNDMPKYSSLPLLIINDGKILKKNLERTKIEQNRLLEFIEKTDKLKNVEVLTIDGNGKCYLQFKQKKYMLTDFTLPEGVSW